MEKNKEVKKMNKATIIGEIAVGEFIGGILNYWITVVRTIIATVKW